jgi:hypothetical protein
MKAFASRWMTHLRDLMRKPEEQPRGTFPGDTTVFVTTVGDEANFTDCMSHLQAQSSPCRIDIIDRVAPMSAAFQEMHRRCKTAYYVQVDEDMILFPHAIETLRGLMGAAPPNMAVICAPLWDCDAEQAIYGVKIYRSSIVKRYPYKNTMSCERTQMKKIRAAGYQVDLLPQGDRSTCLGEHGKHYTPETIFKRWQRCFQKHQQYGNMKWIEPYAQSLLDRYLETREIQHLYAFMGAVEGIAGEAPPDREMDWREPNQSYERLQKYFPVSSAEV